ncbi:MAG: MogA/MoaB family molybdenum cofactor biosynthesis protein [Janthinobacterium lividum]
MPERQPQQHTQQSDGRHTRQSGEHRWALVVTVSNRASAGVYEDTSGPVVTEGLRSYGFQVDGPLVVPDGDPVEEVLRDAVAAGYDVVVTNGGTGLSPLDLTPERTARVLDYEVPGVPEAIRAAGVAKGIATSVLSRGLAGVAGRTFVVNLPGSPGGARDGVVVLGGFLTHAVDQLQGKDHPRPPETSARTRP